MTVRIMAKDAAEARGVARHLKLLEWQFVGNTNALQNSRGAALILAPGASQNEDYDKLIKMARLCGALLFEVDAYRDRFMVVGIFTRTYVHALNGYEEREEFFIDEAAAQQQDGKDGWYLAWAGPLALLE